MNANQATYIYLNLTLRFHAILHVLRIYVELVILMKLRKWGMTSSVSI
jgi:hypothetical protein